MTLSAEGRHKGKDVGAQAKALLEEKVPMIITAATKQMAQRTQGIAVVDLLHLGD